MSTEIKEPVKFVSSLPTEPTEPEGIDPRSTLIYSGPKQGKSTLVALLAELNESYLIIDTEEGQYYQRSVRLQVENYVEYFKLLRQIRNEGRPYKYIAIDTITGFDDPLFVGALGLDKYLKTIVGRDSGCTDIMGLEWGLGYYYQREAFKHLLKAACQSIPPKGGVIFTAHIKDKILGSTKSGMEVSSKDINLPGQLKEIACAKVDAIGLFQRKIHAGKSQGIITFETRDQNVCGLRCSHLADNASFILTQEQEDGTVTANWDKIFIDK